MGVILSGNRLRETMVTARRQHVEQDGQNGSESSIPILRHICNVFAVLDRDNGLQRLVLLLNSSEIRPLAPYDVSSRP